MTNNRLNTSSEPTPMPAAAEAVPTCETCGDSGVVGHAPDDYYPCSDCEQWRDALSSSAPAVAHSATSEALARVNELIAANPYTAYTFVAQNSSVEKGRAEKYARTLLLAAPEAKVKR